MRQTGPDASTRLRLLPQAVEDPTVPFCRTAGTRVPHEHRHVPFSLHDRRVVDVTLCGDRSTDSLVDHANHLQHAITVFDADHETVADPHSRRGPRTFVVHRHMSALARISGEGARLEDPNGAQPFVDTC